MPANNEPGAPVPFPGVRVQLAINCGSCGFWAKTPPQAGMDLKAPAWGMCRRFPPSIHVVGALPDPNDPRSKIPNLQPLRPFTSEGDYCGEFQPAAQVQPPARTP